MVERPHHEPHGCTCPDCQQHPEGATAQQHQQINRLLATLDEKGRRLVAGFLAGQQGRGGIAHLAAVTGLSRNTVRRGLLDVRRPDADLSAGRVRRPGGGRPCVEKKARASSRR